MILILAALASAPLQGRPFNLHERGRDVDYQYRWSGEASAIAPLSARLRADVARTRASTARDAASDRASALKSDYPFHQHSFLRTVTYAGQSWRLASFRIYSEAFTGGAHPNHGSKLMLWDKEQRREVSIGQLFLRDLTPLLRPAFCRALGVEQKKRVPQEASTTTDDMHNCPPLSDVSIVPTDRDKDGKFDRMDVTADAYVAGSYAEGDYRFSLPVTRAMIAALKPAYRGSFEVGQRQ